MKKKRKRKKKRKMKIKRKTKRKKKRKKKKENEDENEDENKNMLLEYIEDADDKLFKKYSLRKNFNSFINEFNRATNEEDKEKIVKELKEINSLVNHYTQWEDDYSEYKNKLFDIIIAIDYFLYEYSKKLVSDF